MKISLRTLGCKLNQAESDDLKEKLAQACFLVVNAKSPADIYLINACAVTQTAVRKTRQIINQAKKRGEVWLVGCVDKNLLNQKGIKIIKNKEGVVIELKKARQKREEQKIHKASQNVKTNHLTTSDDHREINSFMTDRTRALIKIQTGCDNFCTYCIVPSFRGKPRSLSPQNIIKQIKQKESRNYKEIVLTGININKYNYRNYDLSGLVQKILKETSLPRIRFGSIDPTLVNNKFLALFKNPRVLPHLHLSLQNGSDKILKKMNRKYSTRDYFELTKKIKKIEPNFSLTTDIIVGFPGETEKDFKKTLDFSQKIGFLKIHVFPYSPRESTAASLFPDQVEEKIKKGRAKKLRLLSDKLQKKFQQKMLSRKLEVLWEGNPSLHKGRDQKKNYWHGHAENFLKVKIKSEKNLANEITKLVIKKGNLSS